MMNQLNQFGSKQQNGFVLVVSMIFLVVMTLLAISAIKKSTLDEKIASNLRAQNASFQAAEKALRFCERALDLRAGSTDLCTPKVGGIKPLQNDSPGDALDASKNFPTQWMNKENWMGSGPNSATQIPMSSPDKVDWLDAENQPQCMIETWPINSNGPSGSKSGSKFPAWVITARSGSKIDAKGSEDGAVATVWLQEIIRCGNI